MGWRTQVLLGRLRVKQRPDLGFSHRDRIEHARRMGWMCDRVVEANGTVIADFICPTEETRAAFGEAFTIWVDRISAGRFEDTNRMFVPPKRFDIRVTAEGTPQYWAERVLARLRPAFDPQKPTVTSGVRLGTPAGSSRGFGIAEFQEVGELIVEVLDALSQKGVEEDAVTEAAVREKVRGLVSRFPIYNG